MKHASLIAIVVVALLTVLGGVTVGRGNSPPVAPAPGESQPALTVQAVQPSLRELPLTLTANGSVAAWQEAVISADVNGPRLDEIHAEVGDVVRKGQVLAVYDAERVAADVAQAKAQVAEAEANLEAAKLNADRARKVGRSGALSAQQIDQYLTSEKAALAHVGSAQAQLDQQLLRLRHTRVLANDDGVVSSRSATLGMVAVEGQELFRLIRRNRLEWRAEVTASELMRIKVGMPAAVSVPGAGDLSGTVRALGSTLKDESRNALVYVDLPNASKAGFRPGMFAHGEFSLGAQPALTVPQNALSLREGFSYVFRLNDEQDGRARVSQLKVQLGRRMGEWIEVVAGVAPDDRLVAAGAAFLADGDMVRVLR